MADLVYEEMPGGGRRERVYERYIPLVEEFERSLQPTARVRDDVSQAALVGRLRAAIAHSDAKGVVGVKVSGRRTYLKRIDGIGGVAR